MQSVNACTQINRQLLKVISTSRQPATVHRGQQGFYTCMLNGYFLQLITDWHLIHNLPDWPWVNSSVQITQLQQDLSLHKSAQKGVSQFLLGNELCKMPMRVTGQETRLSIFQLFSKKVKGSKELKNKPGIGCSVFSFTGNDIWMLFTDFKISELFSSLNRRCLTVF